MARVGITFDGVSRGAENAAHRTRTAIRGVGDEADRTSRRGSSMGRALRYGIGIAATAGIAGLTGLAGSIAFVGFRFDNLKQQAQIAFTTMLGSGRRATAFLNELQRFAARTPFEFPELIRAAQRLLAMGFAAKQIIPMLTSVGNAVAGLGGDPVAMEATIRAIGQIQAKGRLMAEEMMQLNEAGTFSWKALAAEIGKSVPDAMALVTKGAITADIFMAAFTRNSERRFAGMMDKQSQTFGGLLSTMKDMFRAFAGEAMLPLFNLAVVAMKGIVNANGELTESGQRAARAFGRDLRDGILLVVNGFRRNWPAVLDFMRGAWAAGRMLAQILGRVASAANDVARMAGGWQNAFQLLIAGLLARRVLAVRTAFRQMGTQAVASSAEAGTAVTGLSLVIRRALIATGIGALVVAMAFAAEYTITHWNKVKGWFIRFGYWLEIWANGQALELVEPFSHLPGRFGAWARRAKTALLQQITEDRFLMNLSKAGLDAGNAWGMSFAEAANRAMATPGVEPGSRGGGGGAAGITPRGKGGARVVSVAVQAARTRGAGSAGFHLPGERTPYDCSAFVQAVFKQAGYGDIGSTTYSQVKSGRRIGRASIQPGDVIFMNFPGERSPGHVGIYVGGGMMVHDHGASGGVEQEAVPWGNVVEIRRMDKHGGAAIPATAMTAADLGAPIDVGAGTEPASTAPKGPEKADELERRRDLAGIGWLARNLGRLAPQLRKRIREALNSIARAIKEAKTEEELSAATTRLEKLKDRFAKALDLTSSIGTVRRSMRAISDQIGRLPEAMRGDLEAKMEKIRAALTKVTTQSGLDRLKRDLDAIQKAISAALDRMRETVDQKQAAFGDAWGRLTDKLLRVFDEQTQKLLDNARAFVREFGFTIGVGEQTPTERLLADRERQRTVDEESQRIDELQRQISEATDQAEKDRLQRDLDQAIYDRETRMLQEQADRERKAADEAIAAEQKRIADEREAKRENFVDALGKIEADIVAGKLTAEQAQSAIAKAMEDAGIDKATAAELIGPAFMATLTAAMGAVETAIKALIDALTQLALALGLEPPGGPVQERFRGHPPEEWRAQGGGRIPGRYIGRDSVPLLAEPGEEILDRSLSDALRRELLAGRMRGGGGRVGPVYVLGTTQREVERALARLVEPHLDERIAYRNER